MKVLFIGDIYGKTGRVMLKNRMDALKKKYSPDFIIANGENVDRGRGITATLLTELLSTGIDIVTSGNHVFARKEILETMESSSVLLRPLNYSKACPGKGYAVIEKNGMKLGVINASGRVFMDPCDDPFAAVDSILAEIKKKTKNVLVDFHGEATSEKTAFAWQFDGRISAIIGTHTHVQTADERILPFGTAFISDAGMTGPYEGIIGANKEEVLHKFITGMPVSFTCQEGTAQLNAVYVELSEETGKAIRIERINEIEKS